MSTDLKVIITSWNCRGLQKTKKVKEVMNRIKTLQSKIVFLQETHLTHEDELKVRRRWNGKTLSSPFTYQTRGVKTLIHDSIPLQIHKVVKDKAGRCLIIQGTILREQLILINVYAPNRDKPQFFQSLFLTVASLSVACIMAGDFNCALDPQKDKRSGVDQSHSRSRGVIHQFMKEMCLIYVWREDNPNGRNYSCYSGTHKSYSHIDFFFVSTQLKYKIKEVSYDAILLSDHSPKLTSDFPNWRF